MLTQDDGLMVKPGTYKNYTGLALIPAVRSEQLGFLPYLHLFELMFFLPNMISDWGLSKTLSLTYDSLVLKSHFPPVMQTVYVCVFIKLHGTDSLILMAIIFRNWTHARKFPLPQLSFFSLQAVPALVGSRGAWPEVMPPWPQNDL